MQPQATPGYCPNCGVSLAPGADKCLNCGYELRQLAEPYQQVGSFTCPRCQAPVNAGQRSCYQCALELSPAGVAAFQAQSAVPSQPTVISYDTTWRRFLNEEQDPRVVEAVHARMLQILTRDEQISYIAVQKKPGVTVWPISVAITNKRFIVFRSRMLGQMDFLDHRWMDLRDARVAENVFGATLTFVLTDGRQLGVDSLPKAQARRIYQLAQEREEEARMARHQLDLEQKRAAAGGVHVQPVFAPIQAQPQELTPPPAAPVLPPPAAPVQDPVAVLKQLKSMLEAELITQEEYDKKKTEILARM